MNEEEQVENQTPPKSKEKKQVDPFDLTRLPHLSKEAKEKLEDLKKKLESFKKEVLSKFDKYIMGITLLPPQKAGSMSPMMNPTLGPGMGPGFGAAMGSGFGSQPSFMPGLNVPNQKENKDEISVFVLVDDSDSTKMSKYELKTKLGQIIAKIGSDIDPNINAQTVILSELWQSCYDAKYDYLFKIASGTPVHDTGMLSAIKIAEMHKQMVLKKFEKYIVCYVLAGSLVQGKATKDSDIDVFVVIDDTDVKKMTRIELKDKLRAIIIGMGIEAGELTGIRNKINIQVYILTDFWENIKEANPIIFTFLRDGIPFYDRGIFMPWKQLLKMGKVKPSPEAIDLFMNSGEQMVKTVMYRLKTIGMEDTFYAILTPSQAAIMLYGVPPPTPKETPELMREIFVKKEKLLEEEYVKILENNIDMRKQLEHGTKKEITGKEVDTLLADAQKYLKRIKKLFKQIDKIKEEEELLRTYDNTITILRDILISEGVEKVSEEDAIDLFDKNMVETGKIPHKYLRMLKDVMKAKKDYDAGKLTKTDVNSVRKLSSDIHKFLVEFIQRKRGKEVEKARVRVKHGNEYGEVMLLGKIAYILHNIDAEDRQISKADISEKGSLVNIRAATQEEYEKALLEEDLPPKVFIKEPLFENLKDIFGKDVEIMVSN
jgi:uncharacterized protein (UPF0332 family)/predicted nucleotidyltransferase